MDLDDALATKKALHSLGHFQTPSYGLTEYPDRAMIDGLKYCEARYRPIANMMTGRGPAGTPR